MDGEKGGFVRNFFGTSFSSLLGFFANLRTTCEGFAKKAKLCLCSVPKKVGKGKWKVTKRSEDFNTNAF
jgi:hypothetical protein